MQVNVFGRRQSAFSERDFANDSWRAENFWKEGSCGYERLRVFNFSASAPRMVCGCQKKESRKANVQQLNFFTSVLNWRLEALQN